MKIIDKEINNININASYTIDIGNNEEVEIYLYQDSQVDLSLDNGWDFHNDEDREKVYSKGDEFADEFHEMISNIDVFKDFNIN